MKKAFLLLVICLAMMLSLAACDKDGGDEGDSQEGSNNGNLENGNNDGPSSTVAGTQGLAYKKNDDMKSYKITGIGTAVGVNIVIPAYIDGIPVTAIAPKAFEGLEAIESVTIQDTMVSIGEFAFSNCDSLTSVTIPDGVTSISGSAFYDCDNLSYNEYDNAYYLGNSNNPYIALVKAKNTSITSCNIHEDTKLISNNAFHGCTGLVSMTIPDSVISIGNYAFSDCDSLSYNKYDNAYYLGNSNNPYIALVKAKNTSITSCNIHADTKFILSSVFHNCGSLTSVTIPDSVTSIGDFVFSRCEGLASIIIPDSVTSIGDGAFHSCDSLTSVTIPDSVESISDDAFQSCDSLTSVTIGNGVTSIGYEAFRDCTGLTSVTIPDSVTSIGGRAFQNCDSLTSVTIGNSVISIGDMAFCSCDSLTSVTIPDSVASIGNSAFEDCTNLISVTIPDSVTSIGNSAFAYCNSLTSVTIPDSVTSIGDNAFYWCNSLSYNEYDNAYYLGNSNNPYIALVKAKNTSITSCNIHADTKFILSDAFSYCDSLTNIIVSDSNPDYKSLDGNLYSKDGTVLVKYAIGKADKEFIIPDSVTSIGNYAFRDCDSLTSVTIPDSVTIIGKYAFAYCNSLTSVTIPDSVTSIGYGAFLGCNSLTSVIFENPNDWWCSYSADATNGTSISGLDDAETAAKYLTSYARFYREHS